ncbi:MAG TPA: hypothetical protein VK590_04890, partial [Saprospiraceae bacterium]|nr:hypothetical protein [Saprospiraceae bacterium]
PTDQRFTPGPDQLFSSEEKGFLAIPGTYSVTLEKYEDGVTILLNGPVSFKCVPLSNNVFTGTDPKEYLDFCKKVSDFRKAVGAAEDILGNLFLKIEQIKIAVKDMTTPTNKLVQDIYAINNKLVAINHILNGDDTKSSREFETLPSINARVSNLEGSMFSVTTAPTDYYKESFNIASDEFRPLLENMKQVNKDIEALENELEMKKAPYTPGRWPKW